MPTILVTGFEPFAGEPRNPSAELAEVLGGTELRGWHVESLVLPVVRDSVGALALAAIERLRPAAVVGLGLGSGRSVVCIEQVAVNLEDYEVPDEDGAQPRGQPILKDGPDALLATLPVERLVEAVRQAGIPAAVSRSAGTYLCNRLFYLLLQHAATASTSGRFRAAFVHLPPIPECVAVRDNARASMALETSARAVHAVLSETASLLGPA
jgi:pyroglutamyl-peptidase